MKVYHAVESSQYSHSYTKDKRQASFTDTNSNVSTSDGLTAQSSHVPQKPNTLSTLNPNTSSKASTSSKSISDDNNNVCIDTHAHVQGKLKETTITISSDCDHNVAKKDDSKAEKRHIKCISEKTLLHTIIQINEVIASKGLTKVDLACSEQENQDMLKICTFLESFKQKLENIS